MNRKSMLGNGRPDAGKVRGRVKHRGAHASLDPGLPPAAMPAPVELAPRLTPLPPAPRVLPGAGALSDGVLQVLPYGRVLDCMASAYATEVQAQGVAQQLQREHGLLPGQSLVLKPAHASWLSFRLHARSWSGGRFSEGRCWQTDTLLMALLGALAAGLAGMILLLLGGFLGGAQTVLLLLVLPLAGAAAGCMAAALSTGRPQQRDFNRSVRRELAAGNSVVLAHGVSWPQQARVAGLMREHSVRWCAVSESWRAL